LVNSRTCPMKFKDFQAPALFSSTFKALNLGEKIQVLSRTFKDAWEPCLERYISYFKLSDSNILENITYQPG